MCGEIRLCTFVRFVRYVVTTIGDYYVLLRSRSALCLYGFLPNGFATARYIGKRRRALHAVSSLFVSVDYGKTPTIQAGGGMVE